MRNLREALGIDRIEIERLEEDRDHVAASLLQHGKAPGSGVEMTYPPRGTLWTFREGRVIRVAWFVDPEQAFARLRPQGRSERAMSEENVEIARRFVEGLFTITPEEAGDYWEPDGDYYPVRKFPEARPCHGREEIVRFLAEFGRAWGQGRSEVEDAWAIGDDRVLVHERMSAAGRASGVAVGGDLYHCFWLRHGRFIRVEDHLTAKGALHALGLSGETLEAAGLEE